MDITKYADRMVEASTAASHAARRFKEAAARQHHFARERGSKHKIALTYYSAAGGNYVNLDIQPSAPEYEFLAGVIAKHLASTLESAYDEVQASGSGRFTATRPPTRCSLKLLGRIS